MMTLRKLQVGDLQMRVKWMNDERINTTLNIQLPITLAGTQTWFERIQYDNSRIDFAFIENDTIVAMGGLTNIDSSIKNAELYLFVSPNMKGKGIGTQAVQLMCDYGFKEMNLNKIYLYANSDNIAACRLYEKIGFTLKSIHDRQVINNGKIKDRCYYELLK